MSPPAPGRNMPCPCGSGRKFKHCCLQGLAAEDAARVRLRGAEGRVVDALLRFTSETWGEPLLLHAWEAFWNGDDVPEDLTTTPEFDAMFVPWFVLGFVPDPDADEADGDWPRQPIGQLWLQAMAGDVSDLDRAYIVAACRSPLSVFAIEQVTPGRSLNLRDVLTGSRFRVLEQSASQTLQPADLIFARVLTIDGVSLLLGTAPFVVPPRWHTRVIDWRERLFRRRLMTRQDLVDCDIAIRDLYFDFAAELLDPTPPRVCNTDGDPIALTTLTYELNTTVGDAFEKLVPLATVHGEDHSGEVVRAASGAVTSADLSWVRAGNRRHKHWRNTVLGTLRLEAGRLVGDVNSARRANRLKREIARRLGQAAVLIDTTVVDPSETIEERTRSRAAGARDEPASEPSPEFQAVQDEMRREQWARWLDSRVPALGNKTQRQAARTVRGRERLEALLAEFDRQGTDGPSSMAAHLAAIRHALALTKPPGAGPDQ